VLALASFVTAQDFLSDLIASIVRSESNILVKIEFWAEVVLFTLKWLAKSPTRVNEGVGQHSVKSRAMHWIDELFFDVIPVGLWMITGAQILKHDDLFTDNADRIRTHCRIET
jgi:rhamnogalacturonyl hydrolase YesR